MVQKNDEETPEQPLEDTLTEKTDEINPMEMSSEEKSNTELTSAAALAPTPVLELTHTPEPEKKKYSDSEEEENEQNSNISREEFLKKKYIAQAQRSLTGEFDKLGDSSWKITAQRMS